MVTWASVLRIFSEWSDLRRLFKRPHECSMKLTYATECSVVCDVVGWHACMKAKENKSAAIKEHTAGPWRSMALPTKAEKGYWQIIPLQDFSSSPWSDDWSGLTRGLWL